MSVGRLRLSAVVPIVCSAVAFVLLIILVTAGTRPGRNSGYYLLKLNTSEVGTNLVEIKTANTSSTTTGSIIGGITGLIPGLDGAVNNLTSEVNQGLQDIVNELITAATDSLGLEDEYDIYLQNICKGNRVDQNNPNSQIKIDSCPSFKTVGDAIKGSTNITSYVVVGNTNVSFPFLATLSDTGSTTGTALFAATTANAAFLYVGLVVSGLVALTSVASLVLPRVRLLTLGNMLIAGLAPGFLAISAIVSTTVAYVIHTLLGTFGNAFTIGAKVGGPALALVWVSLVLSVVSSSYWALVWFVDARRSIWARFRRPVEQEGEWKATFLASWRNVRIHDDVAKHPEEGVVPKGGVASTYPEGGVFDTNAEKKKSSAYPQGGVLHKNTDKGKSSS
ncbi:sur7 protein [Apiospora rasikravindrae]|uniref:Sur7 protein n=1 Tax=Apiospora rasikravindrae TaxID=990691 RepID=A0ABR1T6D9_9PEZI